MYAERQTTAAAMIQRLQVLARSHPPTDSQSPEKPAVLPSRLIEDLAALGYVGSRPPHAHATSQSYRIPTIASASTAHIRIGTDPLPPGRLLAVGDSPVFQSVAFHEE